MNFDIVVTALIFIGTIVGLVLFSTRAVYVFGIALISCLLTGVVTEQEIVKSATNSGGLSLILILLASVAVEKTKLIRTFAGKIDSDTFSIGWLKLYLSTGFSSAFLNNTAVVSTLISPVRNNTRLSASKLLLPLSYAAILGGTLTVIGTSTNLLINSMLLETGHTGFSFFDFLPIGVSVFVACGVVLFVGTRFLNDRALKNNSFSKYVLNAKVLPHSSIVGKTVQKAELRHLESLFLVELVRENRVISPVSPDTIVKQSDRLVFSGDIKKYTQLEQFDGLEIMPESDNLENERLTEVVLRQNSHLIGKSLKQSDFRSKFDAAVVAIKRDGESVSGKLGDIKLAVGDFLVLATGNDFHKRNNVKRNFIFASGVEPDHKLKGFKQLIPTLGFLVALVLAISGIMSFVSAFILLLAVNLLTKSLQLQEIRQRFPFEIWTIVSAALVLAHAFENSGIMTLLAQSGLFISFQKDPVLLLFAIYFLALLMTELVTNNAAAALIFPFAYALPTSLGLEPIVFVLAVVFGANASFISPFSYQTNLMVFNLGQYRLGEFIKVGLPVSITYSAVVLSWLVFGYMN